MLPADYIWKEWWVMVEDAKKQLDGDCPLLDDAVIVEMDNYIKDMEDRLIQLNKELQNRCCNRSKGVRQ